MEELEDFFKQSDFNVQEPIAGHQERFFRKLTQPKKKFPFKWTGMVATILLLIGFVFGKNFQQQTYENLKDIDPKMTEAQVFFQSSIKSDLIKIEKHKSQENNERITQTLSRLKDLEHQFEFIQKELKTTNNKRAKILEMIQNYQQRMEILENLLKELEYKQLNTTKYEIS